MLVAERTSISFRFKQLSLYSALVFITCMVVAFIYGKIIVAIILGVIVFIALRKYIVTIGSFVRKMTYEGKKLKLNYYNGKEEIFEIKSISKNVYGEYQFLLKEKNPVLILQMEVGDWDADIGSVIRQEFEIVKSTEKESDEILTDAFTGVDSTFDVFIAIIEIITLVSIKRKMQRFIY